MKNSAYPIIAVLAIAAVMTLSGCGWDDDDVVQPPCGKKVNATVQFRRDLLGASADLPIPPTTDGINGASVSVAGTLMLVNEQWVVLEQGDKELWIPRDNVLLIKIN